MDFEKKSIFCYNSLLEEGVVMALVDKKIITPKIYIPYGIEIELESVSYDEGEKVIRHKIPDTFKIKTDNSLNNGGIEIVSNVLDNTKDNIIMFKKLSKTLKYLGATYENASFQINLDAYDFSEDDILNTLKMYSVYENIIYRFSMGLDNKIRDSVGEYAIPIGEHFYYKYHTNAIKYSRYLRYINNKSFGISLKTLTHDKKDSIKVIEFRTPNGTSEYKLWINYITFFSSFLKIIKSNKFDEEKINYKFEKLNFSKSSDLFKIDEELANELADMIFVDEIDKDNFKNQYFTEDKSLILK